MAQYSGMWTLSQVGQAIKNNNWTGIPPLSVEYLIVAGGGSGGRENYQSGCGGGGGAGGVLAGFCGITPGGSIFVTVGAGAAGVAGNTNGTNGDNSVLVSTSSGASTGKIVALGGGGGGGGTAIPAIAGSGGSGGGAGQLTNMNPGIGTAGQGNRGGSGVATGSGGGGGGAGTQGPDGGTTYSGGNGGTGISSIISGIVTTYGGGGGGSGGNGGGTYGRGGEGGGGDGMMYSSTVAGAGLGNSGGGGGGNANSGATSAAGGSGIVIIRYPGSIQYFTGGTVWATHDGFVVHSFIASGSLAPTTPTQLNPYPVAFGASYGGGYFAGRYTLSGTTYNLIVAPVASGYSASSAYKTANTGDTGANSYSDGLTNSNAINDASHPAAQFCRALTIGGFTDWYLPSVDELNTVYNYLKPGATRNSATPGLGGYNTGAVAPELYNTIHSAGRPRQTGLSTWRVGGVETFGENIYVTSTSDNSATTARNQYWDQGYQWYDNKTNTANKVRAIRKVAI